MPARLLLPACGLTDVVVRQGASILQLLAGEDQTLLIRGDALLILDLLLTHNQAQQRQQRGSVQQVAQKRNVV